METLALMIKLKNDKPSTKQGDASRIIVRKITCATNKWQTPHHLQVTVTRNLS